MISLPRPLVCTLALGLLAPLAVYAKPKVPPDVLVVSDVLTKDPTIQVRPEPGKPIYYYILGKMERDLGSPYAGVKSPDPELVHREVNKALASQGFIETKIGGPSPHIILVITWGQANLASDDITESSTDEEGNQTETTSTVYYNASEMKQLVGAYKAQRQFLSTDEAEQLNENLRSDRVYIFIGALDAQALRKKEKKVIWRTRISIDSRREDLNENLSLMLADAAPYFGRDEEKPVVIDTAVRSSSVKLGELQIINEPSAPAAPEKKK